MNVGDQTVTTTQTPTGIKQCIREYMGGINGNQVFRVVGHVMQNGNFTPGPMLPGVNTLRVVDGIAGGTLQRFVFLKQLSKTINVLCIAPTALMVSKHCDGCAVQHSSNSMYCSTNTTLLKSPLQPNTMYNLKHEMLFHFVVDKIMLEQNRVSLLSLRLVTI